MNETKQDQQQPGDSPESKIKVFTDRLIGHLKEWPVLFAALFINPSKTISAMPASGSWERPLTYVVASYTVVGVWFAISMAWLAMFFQMLIAGIVIYFLSVFVLNLVLGLIKTQPGFYRTAHFAAILTPISAFGSLLGGLHMLFALAAAAIGLYLTYFFFLQAAQLSKKQAGIFIAVLAALVLISTVASHQARRTNMDDVIVNIMTDDKTERRQMKKALKQSVKDMEEEEQQSK